ncbi:MAG: DUF1127 domain-containing protein [Acetobacteraceae bacterium]|nr:DUF1127 domain-containing protein [Acetobacteraceae bacterium]
MTTRPLPTTAPVDFAGVTGAWQGFAARLLAAVRAVGTRRELLEMDQRMLADIGITHSQAVSEARRMPWDIGPTPTRR